MKNSTRNNRSQGFTLVEILVVLAIIAILAAIIFPAFQRAKENGHQTNCAANLTKIYSALRLYYDDEKRYPPSLAALLPDSALLSDYSAPAAADVPNANGTGYLKVSDRNFVCLNDPHDSTKPRSSYGDVSVSLNNGPGATGAGGDMGRWVWNYWGYQADGTAFKDAASVPTAASPLLLDPTRNFSTVNNPATSTFINPVKNSLFNRFAPTNTIITHCVFHRPQTAANIQDAGDLYTTPANDTGARDIILRLDGTVKPTDVSKFKTNGNWQSQNF